MRTHSYSERDYAFGQAMITLRIAMHLTQAALAQCLGVSRGAVQRWEEGLSYPKAEHLKGFIALGVQLRALPAGREEEEIRALWQVAHQKVFLDEPWLSALLGERLHAPAGGTSEGRLPGTRPAPGRRVDWDDALDGSSFYGRKQELALLERWVIEERCRVVSVLGMGGIGKSALAIKLMHQVAESFEVVLFRSLRDAPSCEVLLADCLQVLLLQPPGSVPDSFQQRLRLFLECLHERPALLVLDNLEAVLLEGESAGRYRPGYAGYEQLLRRVGETSHQSCLLMTSRVKPVDLVLLEGRYSSVRTLRLAGLEPEACEQLLAEKGLVGTSQELARLTEAYAGNPLALKIVAETIADLFAGEIGLFLRQGTIIFGSIEQLLAEQFARLSDFEQTVLFWLAIAREPLSIEELLALLVFPPPPGQLLSAIDGLHRRSLVERGQQPGALTLHAVVLEYVTGRLIEEATSEIEQQQLGRLIEHGLSQAGAKDYVRQTQEQLLVVPILAGLRRVYPGRGAVEKHLLALLALLREREDLAQGYGPANVLTLLRELRGHLRGLDLSQLYLRGTYLQGVEMQDATLSETILRDTVFTEAFDAIWSVTTSKSGHYWAAGDRRGEVRVWRDAGQTPHLVWQAHSDTVSALAFSQDEGRLVSGSGDGAITLWEVEHGTLSGGQAGESGLPIPRTGPSHSPLWTVWHTSSILGLTFAPDGQKLASSSANDETVRLWDAKLGTLLETLPHPAPVLAVAWSPHGRLLASGSFDGNIRVWQMQAGQPATCVARLVGHTSGVRGLAFAPDGAKLASASWDRTVKLWDIARGGCLQTLEGQKGLVLRVAWSADGRTVASAGLDATIWLWDVEAGSYRAVLEGHRAPVHSLAFTPDSHHLLSGSDDGTLRVWDVARGQCVRLVQGHEVRLYGVAWSPDGSKLASSGADTQVTVWDLTGREGGTRPRVLRGHLWPVYALGWSPDGKTLASSGWDNAIRLWDPTSGACVEKQQDPDNPDNSFFGMAWSPDGQRLASGTYMNGVLVWEVTARSRRWFGRQLKTLIRCVAWSPNGAQLAGGSEDGHVYLWDASDGSLLLRLAGHQGLVTSVAWSPDGTRLASGSSGRGSGEVLVWDAHRGERLHTFAGYSGSVLALDWSPRGELLVTGDSDGMLRWWEVQSGELVREPCLGDRYREAHQGAIQALRISPDGCLLASCGDDGAIRVWDLERAELLQTLRQDRSYERLNMTGVKGLTGAQKATLHALGAIEEGTLPL